MKTLLATVLMLVLATPGAAWAGGRGCHGHHRGIRQPPLEEPGPDLNRDGRVTTYERIRYERQKRFQRLHGS